MLNRLRVPVGEMPFTGKDEGPAGEHERDCRYHACTELKYPSPEIVYRSDLLGRRQPVEGGGVQPRRTPDKQKQVQGKIAGNTDCQENSTVAVKKTEDPMADRSVPTLVVCGAP